MSAKIGNDLAIKAFNKKLSDSYENVLNTNTSNVISICTNSCSATIAVMNATLQLISGATSIFFIFITIFIINKKVATIASVLIGASYIIVALISKKRLLSNSRLLSTTNAEQIKSLQEGLNSIRDIKLDGTKEYFVDEFAKSDGKYRIQRAESDFIGLFPKYIIEPVGIASICIAAIEMKIRGADEVQLLTVLGAFALGAQRILPLLQQVYSSWAQMWSWTSQVNDFIDMLEIEQKEASAKTPNQDALNERDKDEREYIILKNIKYRYSNTDSYVIDELNMTIRKGENIGFIGSTGCGKSTLMDILMGLLSPAKGRLIVEGKSIGEDLESENARNWRKRISHVPQDLYLADKTILENIAYGKA